MRGKAKLNHLIVHLILLAGTIIVVFPFLWMILTSFKTNGEALQIPPTIIPTAWVTDAYSEIIISSRSWMTDFSMRIHIRVMCGYGMGKLSGLTWG